MNYYIGVGSFNSITKIIFYFSILVLLVVSFQNCGVMQPFEANTISSEDLGIPPIDPAPVDPAPLVKSTSYLYNDISINRHMAKPLGNNGEFDGTNIRCDDPLEALKETSASRLTQTEMKNIFNDILGINIDIEDFYKKVANSNIFVADSDLVSSLSILSSEVSQKFVASLKQNSNNLWKCSLDSNCINSMYSDLPFVFWRRPLNDSEKKIISDLKGSLELDTAQKREDAIAALMEVLISSPQFYIKNINLKGDRPVSPIANLWSLAEKMSFYITGSSPSKNLLDKLLKKEIVNQDQLLGYGEALLDQEYYAKRFSEYLFSDWFNADTMNSNPDEMFGDVAKRGDIIKNAKSNFSQKFMKNQSVESIIYDNNQSGLLDSPFLAMSTFVHEEDTDFAARGAWVMDKVICMTPPGSVDDRLVDAINAVTSDPNFPKDANNLVKAEFHSRKSECASCHFYMDPLSIGLETIGPFGKKRTKYPNQDPISLDRQPASGKPNYLAGVQYQNTPEFLDVMSKTFDFKSCFSQKLHRSIIPTQRLQVRPCMMQKLFEDGSKNIGMKDLVKKSLRTHVFLYKKLPNGD